MDSSNAEDRMLSPPAVTERVSLSRTTLWRMVKKGEFPAPTRLSPGRVAWSSNQVNAWLGEKMARSA